MCRSFFFFFFVRCKLKMASLLVYNISMFVFDCFLSKSIIIRDWRKPIFWIGEWETLSQLRSRKRNKAKTNMARKRSKKFLEVNQSVNSRWQHVIVYLFILCSIIVVAVAVILFSSSSLSLCYLLSSYNFFFFISLLSTRHVTHVSIYISVLIVSPRLRNVEFKQSISFIFYILFGSFVVCSY